MEWRLKALEGSRNGMTHHSYLRMTETHHMWWMSMRNLQWEVWTSHLIVTSVSTEAFFGQEPWGTICLSRNGTSLFLYIISMLFLCFLRLFLSVLLLVVCSYEGISVERNGRSLKSQTTMIQDWEAQSTTKINHSSNSELLKTWGGCGCQRWIPQKENTLIVNH